MYEGETAVNSEKPRRTPAQDQSARFIEAARELGCDESPGAFEAAVKKVARHKPVEEKPSTLRDPSSPPKAEVPKMADGPSTKR